MPCVEARHARLHCALKVISYGSAAFDAGHDVPLMENEARRFIARWWMSFYERHVAGGQRRRAVI